MKTFIFFLLSAVMLTSTTLAQDQSVTYKSNKKAPEITFKSTEYDFGNIPYGADATYDFVFKNTGKVPLILTNVRSSCGCTIASWTKTPIDKKQTDKITVKYNTHRMGNFHKTITVISNAKNSPIVLTITGKIVPIKTIEEPITHDSTLEPQKTKK